MLSSSCTDPYESENTWNPPESVMRGLLRPMNLCKPPAWSCTRGVHLCVVGCRDWQARPEEEGKEREARSTRQGGNEKAYLFNHVGPGVHQEVVGVAEHKLHARLLGLGSE